MKTKEEARLAEDARQESKEHKYVKLKVEEGVRLTVEVRQKAEEEDLRIKAKEAEI